MTATIERKLKSKTEEFRSDIIELENNVKHWQEACAKDVSESAEKCYGAFNDLQMAIAKIDDSAAKKKHRLACYRSTYNFLVFIENKVNPDLFVFLINNAKPFSHLVEHYHKYCARIEKEFDIELETERSIKSDTELFTKIKSYLKK